MNVVRGSWRAAAGIAAIGIATAIGAGAKGAEVASNATPLSLADAIHRGLSSGEEARLAASKVTEAEQQLRIARSALLPEVGAQMTYQRTIRTPFDLSAFPLPKGVSFPFGQKNTWSGGINISQPLYTGGQLTGGVRMARDLLSSAAAQSSEQRAQLELNIVESYYGAVLAGRAASIVDATAESIDAQLKYVKLLNQAGNASELDVLRVSVERDNLEPQRVESANSRALALLNLKRLANIDADTNIVLTDTLSGENIARLAPAELDDLSSRAIERRAAVEAARRGIAVVEEQLKLARAAWLPNVAFSLHLGGQAYPGPIIAEPNAFKDDWSAAVAMQVPLWDNGRRRAQAAVAREQLTQARLQFEQLREGVTLEVLHERGELDRAAALMDARSKTTRQSERVYELTNLSYTQGFATHLQLDDARLALKQARLNEAQALYDYLVALARLEFAAGVPVSLDAARRPMRAATPKTAAPEGSK